MSEISRIALFSKLNRLAYQSFEGATVLCKIRGNSYVELVHWVYRLLELPDSDLHRTIRHFDLDMDKVREQVSLSLRELPSGATAISDFSPHIMEAVERGWVYGSLMFEGAKVRTGHMLIGLLKTRSLRNVVFSVSTELCRIKADDLADNFNDIVGDSPETALAAEEAAVGGGVSPGEASQAMRSSGDGQSPALDQYSVDLTQRARDGEIDPIVGRDLEIRQVIDVLMRRRQNNPILTGEAGVGKTAVVEGLALRIASGDVPPALRDVSLRSLDIGLLQAGASMKGEFENRLRNVIDEVQASERSIILFIDEAHTLMGAGGAAGTGDAANLLKPALARGTLRTVAATTWSEYKKYIEKDPALTRRFQVVKVEQPDETKACMMMRGVVGKLESHHGVQVLDEALEASVQLSSRYIPARQLPDKSVSLLDTACARVAISQHAVPAQVEDARRRIEALQTELKILAKERAVGGDQQDREQELRTAVADNETELAELEARWQQEKQLVEAILGIRRGLASALREREVEAEHDSELRMAELEKLRTHERQLAELQGEAPLISTAVDHGAVAAVVAEWTGIPVGKMVRDQISVVLQLVERLGARIIGQNHALEMISRRVQSSRAGLDDPNKPVGVFLLAGPSGVGKTETALALAETLYGGEDNLITINMSEFQESHTVSTLKGAPPGYVGYGEGGVLTEAVRRRPHSVILLDEVEKAHPDVHEIFFQVFDKGRMEDGEGRVIDFKNTLILLTSNVGSELATAMCAGDERPEPDAMSAAMRPEWLKVFPPALLGRMVPVPYYPLGDEVLASIVRLALDKVKARVEFQHKASFEYDDAVVEQLRSRCTELESGARMVDAILTNTLLPELGRKLLARTVEGEGVETIKVGVADGRFNYELDSPVIVRSEH